MKLTSDISETVQKELKDLGVGYVTLSSGSLILFKVGDCWSGVNNIVSKYDSKIAQTRYREDLDGVEIYFKVGPDEMFIVNT